MKRSEIDARIDEAIGEVSDVNDDRTDNRFRGNVGRFPAIEEDASARYVLCTEYGPAPESGT